MRAQDGSCGLYEVSRSIVCGLGVVLSGYGGQLGGEDNVVVGRKVEAEVGGRRARGDAVELDWQVK